MLANVKIEQNEEKRPYFRVYKDGQEITRVRHIDANFDVDEIPTVNVEIVGGFDFDGMADIHFDYSPQTVKEACKIMRDELLKHEDLYDGFVASILSMLKENSRYIGDGETEIIAEYGENQLAEEILKRIIGEEPNERKD